MLPRQSHKLMIFIGRIKGNGDNSFENTGEKKASMRNPGPGKRIWSKQVANPAL